MATVCVCVTAVKQLQGSQQLLYGRPFVKQFDLCYWTVVCPVLSVCLVCDIGILWPNSWIKMKLGTEVSLGPGHTVLDGDPAPPKGAQPPIFGPCLL